ncbi:MAG: glutamate decarboxylase [Anaerovoracaceae bacterium]
MLYGKKDKKEEISSLNFIGEGERIPKKELNQKPMDAKTAYEILMDELMDEGNARQNLATFCQTNMEDDAKKLMGETLAKNAIDKSEYPRTAELEQYCVNIIADLWNAPSEGKFLGTSTVGSSEACMLGGMAMKFRWRERAAAAGVDIGKRKPNLVITSGYQVCWEKFCVYWDIEMRAVPMDSRHMNLDIQKLSDYVDEYTIGVVGVLGITYTGMYDDIKGIDAWLTEYNAGAKVTVPIHVDGASGGLYTPFVQPDLEWDFRLENVVSINTSGHKYGLVFPGVGWIVWKHEEYLPKELIFNVSYLGGEMPTMAINFSRSASQIIGQYYNFLRLGYDGYKAVHEKTRRIAMLFTKVVEETGYFDVYSDGSGLPLVCYSLKKDAPVEWTLYDLSDRLQMKGWQIPSYPMPENMADMVVQRCVFKADFSQHLVEELAEDFLAAIDQLNKARILSQPADEKKVQGFTH